jgi:hypothetical protein
MPRGKRAPGQTQISISMPKSIVDEIDALAAEDRRTRSNWIVSVIEKRIAAEHAKKELESAAPEHRSTPTLNAPDPAPTPRPGVRYEKPAKKKP